MTLAIDTGVATDTDRTTLKHQIDALLARLSPSVAIERRRDERVAIPVLFRLTPLDLDRLPIECEATTVVGKNLSRRGLSFFHERPIPQRRAVIVLVQPGLGEFAAEIDVRWCRFTRPGWYESGGRLVCAAAWTGGSEAYALPSVKSSQLAGFFATHALSQTPD